MNCAKRIDSRLCLHFEQFSAVTGLILRALLYPRRGSMTAVAELEPS